MRPGWLLALGVLLTPQLALACPYCAGRAGLTPTMLALIGGILLLPYLITWTVVRAVRRTAIDLDTPTVTQAAGPDLR